MENIMEKIIVKQKDRVVIYDDKKQIYIKKFHPKLKNKIKYFFRLRKYPGDNFNYVSQILNKLGIKTPEVVNYSKYHITTKEINGETLEKYFEKNKNEKIIKNYLDILVKMLNNNIYYRDMGPGNFMYDGKDIYAIDLEGYLVDGIFTGRNTELEERLNKGLKNKEWVKYVLENLK